MDAQAHMATQSSCVHDKQQSYNETFKRTTLFVVQQ